MFLDGEWDEEMSFQEWCEASADSDGRMRLCPDTGKVLARGRGWAC